MACGDSGQLQRRYQDVAICESGKGECPLDRKAGRDRPGPEGLGAREVIELSAAGGNLPERIKEITNNKGLVPSSTAWVARFWPI